MSTDDEERLPEWCEGIFQTKYKTQDQEFDVPEDWAMFYVENVKIGKDKIRQLCELTTKQGQCSLWRQERKSRITSSRAHKILRARSEHKRIEYFLDHKSLDHISHVRRGIELEPIALEKYKEVTGNHVVRVGLVVKDEQFWLAGSPDGIFQNEQNDVCVLEIKCPESIEVPWLNSDGKLKEKDPYYTQIQLNMYICNAASADLFIYTQESYKLVHVPFNMSFC